MIYDVHQHLSKGEISTEVWKADMAKAGIKGGCAFSPPPVENRMGSGCGFEERLDKVLTLCGGDEDLYPVLFIHPYEDSACEKAREASERGVAAFKIICNNFYVNDGPSMRLAEVISQLNKPVFYHTGIIWNGGDSSKYNRPVFWEALIDIKKLRFSTAHCSWPWIDECIAVYGKFLNGTVGMEDAPEMFFDLTPGTPEIYRRELFYKLLHVGYDVPNNMLWGTDNICNKYNVEWAKRWLDIDNGIFDEFNISEDIRQRVFGKNFLRFMGKTTEVERAADAFNWKAQ